MKTIQAKHYYKGRLSPIRLIVVHTMEWPERVTTAEDCARMFSTMTRAASAHVCVDSDSAVRCVADKDTAWAAPGGNADGLQMELAGFARQTRTDWQDTYSKGVLSEASVVAATWAKLHKLPVRKLSRAELKAGKKGFTTHADISAVYKRSDHTDPGANFPWDLWLDQIRDRLDGEDDGDDQPSAPKFTVTLKAGVKGEPVLVWQRRMRARGWNVTVDGAYSDADAKTARQFQIEKGMKATGVIDAESWRAAWTAPIT